MATAHYHKVEPHLTSYHISFNANYPPGSVGWAETSRELKTALSKQQFFFPKAVQKLHLATAASLTAANISNEEQNKKPSYEEILTEAMIIANRMCKDEKNGPDVISTLSDVQLGQIQ